MTATSSVRLDHVGVNVPELEPAVAFFKDVFDATVMFRLGKTSDPNGKLMERTGADRGAEFEAVMLRIGDGNLELLQWSSNESLSSLPAAVDVGASHIGIEVPDLAVVLERAREVEGVQVIGDPVTFSEGPTPGLSNAFFRTPWGAIVELLHWGQ